MGESKEKLIKAIKHYQDSLERHTKTGNTEKLLHGIEKLSKLPIKVCHLEETGVGRTVNGLKKFEGHFSSYVKKKSNQLIPGLVGDNARLLVDKWKSVVKGEEEEEARLQQERLAQENDKIDESSHRKNGDRKRKISKSSDSESDKDKRRRHDSDSDNSSRNSSPKSSTESDSESSDEDYRKNKSGSSKTHEKNEPRSSSSKCDKNDEISKHSSSSKRNQSNSDKEKSSSDKSKHKSSSDRNKSSTDTSRSTSHKSVSSSDKHRHKQSDHRKSSSNHSDRKKEQSKKDEAKKESKDSKEDRKRKESNRDLKNHKRDEKSPSSSSSKGKVKKEVRNEESSRKSDKRKSTKHGSGEIDSGSGTSFADALGMLEPSKPSKNKKRSLPIEEKPSSSQGPSTSKEINRVHIESSISQPCNLLQDPGKLEPLDINISSLLPSITPNYKPIGFTFEENNRKRLSDDEALTRVITAKHQRTKVYSGNKSGYTKVPTLFEICSRILQENLDALEYTGGVPYLVLKSILERASAEQLYQLEFHNPYLVEDTDELWQLHCQREFRNKKREEMESWREMYMRCLDERDAKLKALTANIKQSQVKSIPVRQTKLAYVDSVVKPPRNVLRKQVKNGTGADLKRPAVLPKDRAIDLARAGEAGKVSVPNPGRSAVERGPNSHHSSSNFKPKKAPLMAKTLSLMKNRFGRR